MTVVFIVAGLSSCRVRRRARTAGLCVPPTTGYNCSFGDYCLADPYAILSPLPHFPRAGVAELADAPDSKSGEVNHLVGVRLPPPAPMKSIGCGFWCATHQTQNRAFFCPCRPLFARRWLQYIVTAGVSACGLSPFLESGKYPSPPARATLIFPMRLTAPCYAGRQIGLGMGATWRKTPTN